MAETIPVTCDPEGRLKRLPVAELIHFQGHLKTLHTDQYQKLKTSMLEYGFFAPVFIWAGHNHILDGHQRFNMLTEEQWEPEGGVPVVEIEAKDEKEAAEKLLLFSSTYGKIDGQGLYEFAETKGVDLQAFTLPDLPNIDIDAFLGEYYESTPDFAEVGEDEQGKLDEQKMITCPHCQQQFTSGDGIYS